jgi:hypothetical protein
LLAETDQIEYIVKDEENNKTHYRCQYPIQVYVFGVRIPVFNIGFVLAVQPESLYGIKGELNGEYSQDSDHINNQQETGQIVVARHAETMRDKIQPFGVWGKQVRRIEQRYQDRREKMDNVRPFKPEYRACNGEYIQVKNRNKHQYDRQDKKI